MAEHLWRAWSGPAAARAAAALLAAAAGLLFLEGAATLEAVYTLRVSYVLAALACAVGLPAVLRGWAAVPSPVRWTAGGLLAAYALAAAAGDPSTMGEGRAGGHRQLVYLADLGLGLACVGLVVGCCGGPPERRRLLGAFVAGGVAAAAYAVYQWPAFRFGWPLSDVNNALNTHGLGSGRAPAGVGLLGWARPRSTFREPHLLAGYLAALLPIALAFAASSSRRTRGAALLAAALMAAALGLTLSVSTWAILAAAAALALCLGAIARHLVAAAAVTAAGAVALALFATVALAQPQRLTSVTGRDAVSLTISTRERTGAWSAALATFEARPVVGHGPGQSAVRLAEATPDGNTAARPPAGVLGTAHGVFLAALVDAGVLGFAAWMGFLGAVLVVAGRAALQRPDALRVGMLATGLVTALSACVAGDRLDQLAWLLVGAVLVVSVARPRGA